MQKHEEHIRREYDAAASFGADRAGCRHAMRLESTAKLRAHKYLQRLKAQSADSTHVAEAYSTTHRQLMIETIIIVWCGTLEHVHSNDRGACDGHQNCSSQNYSAATATTAMGSTNRLQKLVTR
eukprot:19805-Heterococcus_DN1.PRE.1